MRNWYAYLRLILFPVLVLMISTCSENATDSDTNLIDCLEFDGVDDFVQVEDTPNLDVNETITLSAWYYYPGGISGEPGLIQKDGSGSYGRYGLWIANDKVDFCIYIDGGSQACLLSGQSLTLNKWHHIAGVYGGSKMTIYIDGESAGEKDLAGNISISDRALFIGSDPTENSALPGKIREVCIWNKARTQTEIQNNMNNSLSGSEPGLVLYLKMNEGMGQVAADKSSMGNNGQLGLTPTADDSDPKWVEIVLYKMNVLMSVLAGNKLAI